jgi:hypothetical protein
VSLGNDPSRVPDRQEPEPEPCRYCPGKTHDPQRVCPDCRHERGNRLVPDGGEEVGRAVKQGAVLYDTRGNTTLDPVSDRALCHVVSVFEEVGTGDRLYNVWDGTHTYQEFVHEDRLLEDFEPAGWTFPRGSKPLYHLTRNCGVDDPADLMTDGGEEVGRGGPHNWGFDAGEKIHQDAETYIVERRVYDAGEKIHQDAETYTVERRVYDADNDEALYWLQTPTGGHALKTETVVEAHYERGEAGVECSNCGFTDQEEHFDNAGMDLMCPHCGKVGVSN